MHDYTTKFSASGPGLLLGIPTLGRPVPLSWATSYKSLNPPINFNMNVMVVKGLPVAVAREQICEKAVELGSKYIFFLGDDVVVPANTLKQLIYRMEQNEKISVVGGVYCSKSDPPAPLVFRGNGQGTYWDWKVGEFFEVSGLGMDCTLIRTSVLKEIPKPWFKTVDDDDFDEAVNNAVQWTEDLWFCKQVYDHTKSEIWCDASIICEHWDVYSEKAYHLPAGSLPTRRLKSDREKKAIDIGCGPIDRSEEFPEHTLVRVDIRDECNPDYRVDVSNLPFAAGEFDLVFSSHVLEHFPRDKWEGVLKEWIRILHEKGELILVLPNVEWAFDTSKPLNDRLNVLYGAQSNPYDFHYNGLWPSRMESALRKHGFTDITVEHIGYNMVIRAKRGNELR